MSDISPLRSSNDAKTHNKEESAEKDVIGRLEPPLDLGSDV